MFQEFFKEKKQSHSNKDGLADPLKIYHKLIYFNLLDYLLINHWSEFVNSD